MSSFSLSLRPIIVDPSKLLLDPNNPRFVTSQEEHIAEERITDPAVIVAASEKMRQERFHVNDIVQSILTNGWQPVDAIFVRMHLPTGHFLVLEGNRRVAAIQSLLAREDLSLSVRQALATIEVLEVHGEAPPNEYDRQVAYLLGVRHHGALKKWSPFAQARNIFSTYLDVSGASSESDFRWNEEHGRKVAEALTLTLSEVRERLTTYRAMISIAQLPAVGLSNMKDRYYSLIAELCKRRRGSLGTYVVQDPESLLFEPDSAHRINNLCHFSDPRREGSPIASPQEWKSLERILADEDEPKRAANLCRVEIEKESPSVVWAQRSQELRRVEWSRWLEQVTAALTRVQLGDIDVDDAEAAEIVRRLTSRLRELRLVDGG